jgi:hypothetical protein
MNEALPIHLAFQAFPALLSLTSLNNTGVAGRLPLATNCLAGMLQKAISDARAINISDAQGSFVQYSGSELAVMR